MADSSKLLGFIERNEKERVQISVTEYKGKSNLDIRIFYTTDGGETWRPTQKGVTCAPESLDILKTAIEDAIKEFTAIE